MLSDEIDRYLLSLMTLRSPATIAWYRKRLDPLRLLSQNISSICLSDLQAVYAQLANQKSRWVNHPSGRASSPGGLSPDTLRGYVRAWRGFFNWLVDDGILSCSPAAKLKLPRLPDQPPKSVTRSDMELIIEAALTSQPWRTCWATARYRRRISSMAAGTPTNCTRCMIAIHGFPLRKLTLNPLPC